MVNTSLALSLSVLGLTIVVYWAPGALLPSFAQSVNLFLNAILTSRTLLFCHCDIACAQYSGLQP